MKTLFVGAKVRISKNNFHDVIGFDSKSGLITFTGNKEEADSIKKEYDEVIDAGQKLILPAFTDGHCHFIKGSLVNSQLNLRNAVTVNNFKESIREYRKSSGDKWIYGGYFSEANFEERIYPDTKFLDEIISDVPVIISRFDMHSAFANSKAIEISGILNQENNFTSEELIKDEEGKITGEVKERARDFIMNKIPMVSLKGRTDIASKQIQKLHSFGITGISDITLEEDLEVYKELIRQEKLLIDVDSRLPFQELEKIPQYRKEFGQLSNKIKFNSLKAFYDGSLSSKTALMHSNFINTDHNGIRTEFVVSGEFEKYFYEIDEAGMQMSVHAIGDKSVTELLDMNEELIKKSGHRDRRFRIEHAQHIAERDFQRFLDLNIIASVQPAHLFSDAKTSKEILKDFTIEHNYKKLFDIGSAVCFGTDFPVVGENPFETIFYAMTRKVKGFEDGFVKENIISLDECIDAYTIQNAFAAYDENRKGSLHIGKAADLIILETDLFKIKPDEIKDAKVLETYLRGNRVY